LRSLAATYGGRHRFGNSGHFFPVLRGRDRAANFLVRRPELDDAFNIALAVIAVFWLGRLALWLIEQR
jgi:hypothetical protein